MKKTRLQIASKLNFLSAKYFQLHWIEDGITHMKVLRTEITSPLARTRSFWINKVWSSLVEGNEGSYRPNCKAVTLIKLQNNRDHA